ncbi:hypothetical protein DICVIV_11642 [Dictyocaulus viviparus]|uniref:Uncharacterized protein n=1 Tax=Dictyocaulus viviparus TaxID=29172 RepID=A0A0D8XFA4_DICVI|nr:hypothetical protein DICVIV_11642 [Dictyocaulus viviparus]
MYRRLFSEIVDKKDEEKIKVTIPPKERSASRRRKSDMAYSNFCESISSQIPLQLLASVSGRTTPLNDYDGDILEENPQYRKKAPPPPVVHRRASIEWENFGESKGLDIVSQELQNESTAKVYFQKAKVEATAIQNQLSEDDKPMFSEDMFRERERSQTYSTDTAKSIGPNIEAEQTSELESSVATKYTVNEYGEKESKGEYVAEASETAYPTESSEVENQEQAYDPITYPEHSCAPKHMDSYMTILGYIWNYETQQWEVDPNYNPNQYPSSYYTYQYPECNTMTNSQGYGYDQAYDKNYPYDQNYGYTETNQNHNNTYTFDGQLYGRYQQQGTYDNRETGASYTGYDGSAYTYENRPVTCDGNTIVSDNTVAGYGNAAVERVNTSGYGYDQQYTSTTDQDQSYFDQSYYQTHAGYDQSITEFSEPHIGYDQPEDSDSAIVPTTENNDNISSTFGSSTSHYPSDYSTPYTTNQQTQGNSASSQIGINVGLEDQYSESRLHGDVNDYIAPPFTARPWTQSTQSSEPYAWESASHEFSTISPPTHTSEKHSPSRPPPPSRPAPPKFPRTGAAEEQLNAAHPPPPRPPPALVSSSPERNKPPLEIPSAPKKVEIEEDAWTQFQKLTEKVNLAVKSTESTLKTLGETSAADEIKDESYLGQIGGTQGYVDNIAQKEIYRLAEQKKQEKQLKKKMKQQGKRAPPSIDPDNEASMDRAAQELAMKMASMRTDIGVSFLLFSRFDFIPRQ